MPHPSRPVIVGAAVAVVAVLAGLALLGAGSSSSWRVQLPTLPSLPAPPPLPALPQDTAVPTGLPQVGDTIRPPAHFGLWVGGAALLVVVLVLAVLLARWLSKRHLPVPGDDADRVEPDAVAGTDEEVRRAVVDAVDAALARLDAVGPPRDAVVAAWMELEAAALRVGVERDPAQTPTEFTADLLAGTSAPPDAVAALRRRYHAARFSRHPVSDADVAAARGALGRIATALARPGRAA